MHIKHMLCWYNCLYHVESCQHLYNVILWDTQ